MAEAKSTQDDRFARFKEHLRAERLKSTEQRDTIARVFLATQRHISVEELYMFEVTSKGWMQKKEAQ